MIKQICTGTSTHLHPHGFQTAIINQTNAGTVSEATVWKLLRDRAERIWAFSESTDTILNGTNYTHMTSSMPEFSPDHKDWGRWKPRRFGETGNQYPTVLFLPPGWHCKSDIRLLH